MDRGDQSTRGVASDLDARIRRLEAVTSLAARVSAAADVAQVFGACLDALAEAVTLDRASILLFDPDGVLRFKAWRGLSDGYRAAVEGHSPWKRGQKGVGPIVVPDVEEDASLRAWRDAIIGEGIRALAFIPLESGGGTIGKFMLYRNEPGEFTEEELEAARLIAHHVSLGIERLSQEEAVRSSRDELAAILEGVVDAVTAQDASGRIVYANAAAAKAIGFESVDALLRASIEEILGRFEMMDPEGKPLDPLILPGRRALRGERPPEMLVRFRVRGTPVDRWSMVKAAPVFNSDGSVRYAINVFRDVTGSRLAELALRSANEMLRGIVRASPLAVMVLEPADGTVRLWNPAAERIFGWSEDEVLGRPLPTVPDSLTREFFEALRGVPLQSDVVNLETRRRTREGREIEVAVWMTVLQTSEGPPQVLSIVADVSERKNRERASRLLADASALLSSSLDYEQTLGTIARLAVREMADWCVVHMAKDNALQRLAVAHRDPEKVRWAEEVQRRYPTDETGDRGVAKVFRTGRSELIERVPEALLLESARDEEHLDLLRRAELRSVMIVPLRARDRVLGAITFVSSDPARHYDRHDLRLAEELAERAGLAIDNAMLFQREQEARRLAEETAARISLLQHVAGDLSEAATEEKIAEVILRHAVGALGAAAASVAVPEPDGRTLRIVRSIGYPPELVEQFARFSVDAPLPIAEAMRKGEIVVEGTREAFLAHYPLLEGKAVPTYAARAAVPMRFESRSLGAIGLSFAEARRFGEEERDLLLAVGRLCAQALDRARLYELERQARAEAEAANRAKDEFLATLSHELRTPMTATLGWARMLTMLEVDPETVRLAAESIHRSAQSQARIVDDLLDVARIVTGKMSLEVRPTPLQPIVHGALESVRAAAEAKAIAVHLDLDPAVGPVSGDPDRLRQVAWNLLSNAIKFTPAGGRVEVALARHDSSAVLTVRDTGQGIRADLLPHVFERFRQGDSSASRAASGLGLGLSIVRHLVELHGGSISAESPGEGKGSTFRVSIPLAEIDVFEDTRSRPRALASRPLQARKLLVVDDEPDTRAMLAELLRRNGAEVRTAGSVAEAMAILSDWSPDVLLSDLAMPFEDGYSLAQKVRASGGVRLPIIALTAYGRPEDRERALSVGFNAYVRKPIEPEILLDSIHDVLGRS